MRIVAVSSRPPWPATRGDAMRLSGFLRTLARDHEVVCLSPRPSEEAVARLAAVQVQLVRCELSTTNALSWALSPAQVALYGAWRAGGRHLAQADVIHVSTVRSIPLVPRHLLDRVHLDFVDALSVSTRHRVASSRVLGPFWRLEASRLARLEHWAAARVRTTSCTSASDAAALGEATHVLPFGVTVPAEPPPLPEQPSVSFLGNLGYFPNVQAARRLAHSIFPLVRARVPAARLTLVGARPAREVRALAALPGVFLAADVPDVVPYLEAATVFVAPLQAGTGLQTKVLEAMARARPVVTSADVAARLQGSEPGRNLVTALDDDDFAAAVCLLLADHGRAVAVGRAGYALAQSYSWERFTRQLLGIYAS